MFTFPRLVAAVAFVVSGCGVGQHTTTAQPSAAPLSAPAWMPAGSGAASPTPTPIHLTPKTTPDPVLAALARQVAAGPAPRRTTASVHNVHEVWTREDNNLYVARRIISWRDSHGAGYIRTWALPPSPRFTTAMPGRTLFHAGQAAQTTEVFGPGQMPHHTLWPLTLAAQPQTMMQQLGMLWPVDSPADLLRAVGIAHTRYLVTRQVRAAELTLLATTDGITTRVGDIPTYAQDNTPMPGLTVTAEDTAGRVILHLDSGTGYLHSAVEYTAHRGPGWLASYLVYLEADDRNPHIR